MNTKSLRRTVDRKLASFIAAKQNSEREAKLLTEAQAKVIQVKEAQSVAQAVAASVQAVAHQKIADIVTRSLSTVFEDSYTFRVVFAEKRGRTEASLIFSRDGFDLDPMTASGGGVVAVASFALRLSCLLLSNPPVRRLLVLDEPLSALSAEFRAKVALLLMALSKELGVQMIIITHLKELTEQGGKVIQL